MHRENTAPRNSENSQTTTGSAEGPPLPSLKRSRVLSSCDSERSAGPDVSGSISWGSEARFSWRNNGPVRRVKRNVKWAFQLESFPAPDFQKRRPVFGLGVQVKGILKRSVATVSRKREVAPSKEQDQVEDHEVLAPVLKSHPVSELSLLSEPSTNSGVSSQFEEDVCDGDEQVQNPVKRRTKFKLLVSPSP